MYAVLYTVSLLKLVSPPPQCHCGLLEIAFMHFSWLFTHKSEFSTLSETMLLFLNGAVGVYDAVKEYTLVVVMGWLYMHSRELFDQFLSHTPHPSISEGVIEGCGQRFTSIPLVPNYLYATTSPPDCCEWKMDRTTVHLGHTIRWFLPQTAVANRRKHTITFCCAPLRGAGV